MSTNKELVLNLIHKIADCIMHDHDDIQSTGL